MIKNLAAVIIIIVLAVELYLASNGQQHKKKKLLSGWNRVNGTIISIEKKPDELTKKTIYELYIETEAGNKVYAKEGIFCIYEVGETVELQEKDGYHKLLGNDRVSARGKKEMFWGIVPILIIVGISLVLSILF